VFALKESGKIKRAGGDYHRPGTEDAHMGAEKVGTAPTYYLSSNNPLVLNGKGGIS
jgi:hypothetical protein